MSTGIEANPVLGHESDSPGQTIEAVDADRLLNVGEEITLSKLGKVTVKELSLEQLVICASELTTILADLDISGKLPPSEFLRVLLQQESSVEALRVLAAASTGKKSDDFRGMGILDWLKWMTAVKKVCNWEELRELFIQLGLPGIFKQMAVPAPKLGQSET